MKLYDFKGEEILIITYRESMGFIPVLIPIESEDSDSTVDIAAISSDYLDQDFTYCEGDDPGEDDE